MWAGRKGMGLLRLCLGAALVGGGLLAGPAVQVHAGSACVTDYTGDELNPIVSRSDYLADADNSRPYADITGSICGNNPATSLSTVKGTVEEASFSIPVGPIPAFPVSDGDLGMLIQACADFSGPLGTQVVQIGTGHRGGPVFDGPYPGSQGWKYCTYASMAAGVPNDYGVQFIAPDGDVTTMDFPRLKDTAGNPTITAPSGLATGSTSVTLYMPETLVYQVDAVPPPFRGEPHNYVEPVIANIGATGPIDNAVVDTQIIEAGVSAPFPFCVNANPLGISCNGNQISGPTQGVASETAFSDWAPGKIACSVPGDPLSCHAYPAPSGQANGYDLGVFPAPNDDPTCADPTNPGPPTPPTNNPLVTCTVVAGTYSYNPCQMTSTPDGQDQGDLTIATGSCPVGVSAVPLPYVYEFSYGGLGCTPQPALGGFTPYPCYLPTGWNF